MPSLLNRDWIDSITESLSFWHTPQRGVWVEYFPCLLIPLSHWYHQEAIQAKEQAAEATAAAQKAQVEMWLGSVHEGKDVDICWCVWQAFPFRTGPFFVSIEMSTLRGCKRHCKFQQQLLVFRQAIKTKAEEDVKAAKILGSRCHAKH